MLWPALLLILSAPSAQDSHPRWMEGVWDARAIHDPRSWDCTSGTDSVVYRRDGAWTGVTLGDSGRWWIRGDRLYWLTLDPGGSGPGGKGMTTSASFRRIGRNELRMVGRRGPPYRLVRCLGSVSGWFDRG